MFASSVIIIMEQLAFNIYVSTIPYHVCHSCKYKITSMFSIAHSYTSGYNGSSNKNLSILKVSTCIIILQLLKIHNSAFPNNKNATTLRSRNHFRIFYFSISNTLNKTYGEYLIWWLWFILCLFVAILQTHQSSVSIF